MPSLVRPLETLRHKPPIGRPALEVADIFRARLSNRVIVEGRRHRNFIILAPTPTPNWGRRRHKIGFVIAIKPISRGRHQALALTQ